MNIALVAQDSKKELMVRFCIAYVGILSRHKLCATATTGKLISNATGLRIVSFLSGEQGGCQQIASRISCGEIDMVIFFRGSSGTSFNRDGNDILRLCDVHTIPCATNIATAEALIHSLERGDLDWLTVGRPSV